MPGLNLTEGPFINKHRKLITAICWDQKKADPAQQSKHLAEFRISVTRPKEITLDSFCLTEQLSRDDETIQLYLIDEMKRIHRYFAPDRIRCSTSSYLKYQ
jgi:hypothetical protein